MATDSLSKKNDRAAITEYEREEAVLGKYRDMGFFSLDEAMTYISEKITGIENDLKIGGTHEF